LIVISGALVLISLVLLLIGLLGTGLGFIYASIVVSVLAFVFLLLGILLRRGDPVAADGHSQDVGGAPHRGGRPPAGDLEKAEQETVSAVAPRPVATADVSEPPAEHDDERLEEQDADIGGLVFVVQGRPRYHVQGCSYLSGGNVELVDVVDAREEGFSPCGNCRPDASLAADAELRREGAAGAVTDLPGNSRGAELSAPDAQVAAAGTAARSDVGAPLRPRPVAVSSDPRGIAALLAPADPPVPGPVVRGAAARSSAAAVLNRLRPAPRPGYVPGARSRPVRQPAVTSNPAPTDDPGARSAADNSATPTTDSALKAGSGTHAVVATEPTPPSVD
jgi:hypothetical protein